MALKPDPEPNNNKKVDTADFEHRKKNFIKSVKKEAFKYQVDIIPTFVYTQTGILTELTVIDIKNASKQPQPTPPAPASDAKEKSVN